MLELELRGTGKGENNLLGNHLLITRMGFPLSIFFFFFELPNTYNQHLKICNHFSLSIREDRNMNTSLRNITDKGCSQGLNPNKELGEERALLQDAR